jgi:hypothetical protein
MNKLFLLFITLLSLVFFKSTYAQTPCDELFKYRDNQLIKDYDEAYKKYNVNKEKLERYKKYKNELENISFGKTSKTIGEIAMSIEAACKLSKEILSLIPAAKLISKVEEIGFFTVDIIQKKFDEGKTSQEIITEIAEDKANEKFYKELYPAYQAAEAIYDYYEKIKEMKEFSKEAGDYLEKVKEQMKTYEDAITKYQIAVDEQKGKIDQINEIKNAIDKYCGGSPIIKITSNLDCKFSIDMEEEIFIVKDDIKEIKVEKGEHFLIAKSVEKGLKFDTKFNILKNQINPIRLEIFFSQENVLNSNNYITKADSILKLNINECEKLDKIKKKLEETHDDKNLEEGFQYVNKVYIEQEKKCISFIDTIGISGSKVITIDSNLVIHTKEEVTSSSDEVSRSTNQSISDSDEVSRSTNQSTSGIEEVTPRKSIKFHGQTFTGRKIDIINNNTIMVDGITTTFEIKPVYTPKKEISKPYKVKVEDDDYIKSNYPTRPRIVSKTVNKNKVDFIQVLDTVTNALNKMNAAQKVKNDKLMEQIKQQNKEIKKNSKYSNGNSGNMNKSKNNNECKLGKCPKCGGCLSTNPWKGGKMCTSCDHWGL